MKSFYLSQIGIKHGTVPSSSLSSSTGSSPGWTITLSPPMTRTPTDILLLVAGILPFFPSGKGACWLPLFVSNGTSGFLAVSRLEDEVVANLGDIVNELIGKRFGVNPLKKSSRRISSTVGRVVGSGRRSFMINSWAVCDTLDGI